MGAAFAAARASARLALCQLFSNSLVTTIFLILGLYYNGLSKSCETLQPLAEHSGISQEQVGPLKTISPPEDKIWDKCMPHHVITLYC